MAVAAAAAALSGHATAAATTTTTTSATSTTGVSGLLRTVTRNAGVTMGSGAPLGTPSGLQSPELRPQDQANAAAVRSHSLRPSQNQTYAAATGTLQPPAVNASTVQGSPGLTSSWEGLNGFQQRYANNGNQFSVEPPDQALCAGNGYVLEAVNDVLRVYAPGGKALTGVVDLNSFYGYRPAINRTTLRYGPFVTDPTCIFDHGSGKFYLVVLTLNVKPATGDFTLKNHLDLAVSRTGNPTKGWDIYRLPVQDDGTDGTPTHKGCPCIGDYPHVGSDANAVFVTTNEYPFGDSPGRYGNGYNGAQIYAFDKRALANASDHVRVVQFQDTSVAGPKTRIPGFTVWPAQVPDSHYDTNRGGTEHFLSSIAGDEAQPAGFTGIANHIGVYSVTNTSSIRTSTPNLRLHAALLKSQVYAVPPRSSQRVGPVPLRDCLATSSCAALIIGPPNPNEAEGPLDSGDSRMQQVYYSGGRLYGALDTAMRVSGSLQAGVAWFSVNPGSAPADASMARQGYVGLHLNNVNYPAIAVLPDGTGIIAMSLVGRGHYPTSAYVRFGAGGTSDVHIAAACQAPQDGFSEYNSFRSPPRPRWGDYSAAVTSGNSVYMANEYIAHLCRFAQFQQDFTCGSTRGALINWSTNIARVTP